MSNYTEEEIQEQLRYLGNARRVTSEERERVMTELGGRTRDSGPFSWVKCPVWRLRLNEVSRAGVVEGQTLSAILRYVLEGDRESLVNVDKVLMPSERVPCSNLAYPEVA